MVKQVFTFSFIFLLSLIIIELFLSNAEIVSGKFRYVDNEMGLTYLPDRDIIMFNEGFYLGNTNDFGYFDYLDKDRKEEELVIALVGDSYAVGQQMMKRNHFSSKLEDQLEKKMKRAVKVLNFGMMEYDFCDMYARYNKLSKYTKPDITVVLLSEKDFNCINNSGIPDIVLKNNKVEVPDFSNEENQNGENGYGIETLKETRIWKLLSNCRRLYGKNKAGEIFFGKFHRLFQKEQIKESTSNEVKVNIDDRIKPILDQFPTNTLLVFSLESALNLETITNNFKGEVSYLFPVIDTKSKMGEFDPRYWPGTKRLGHYNQQTQPIMGEKIAAELLIAMSKWGIK